MCSKKGTSMTLSPTNQTNFDSTDQNLFLLPETPATMPVEIEAESEKSSWIKRTANKIWKIFKWVLKALVGIALFVTSPSFFAIGFVVGLIFSNKVRETIDKILLICKKQPWLVIVAAGLGGFLALPVTLAVTALFFGAYVGTSLSRCAEESKKDEDLRTV